MTEGIIMDGRTYRVRVAFGSRKRSFSLISGKNAGESLNHRRIRDLLGSGYSYQLQVEPNPSYPADYDDFYHAISAPVDYHTVTMPYGQTTITFQAAVTGGEDMDRGMLGGARRWSGLTVNFVYMEPQRRP